MDWDKGGGDNDIKNVGGRMEMTGTGKDGAKERGGDGKAEDKSNNLNKSV